MRFPSEGAFIAALNKAKIDRVWPKEEKGNDHATWNLEYIAFFATAAERQRGEREVLGGHRRLAALRGRRRAVHPRQGTRIFASNITLGKPEFEENKQVHDDRWSPRRRIIASTTFWLRGKGPNYSGKVEFSDDEAKGK